MSEIDGYRILTEKEIDLINTSKDFEKLGINLIGQTRDSIAVANFAHGSPDAEPLRWAQIAQDYLQLALMALNRAIARPAAIGPNDILPKGEPENV